MSPHICDRMTLPTWQNSPTSYAKMTRSSPNETKVEAEVRRSSSIDRSNDTLRDRLKSNGV